MNASHHANEWITSPALMRCLSHYAQAVMMGEKLNTLDARTLYRQTTLLVMPMVNPDGVDLVTGALNDGPAYEQAQRLSKDYGTVLFPSGWKANICGVDLNLQYPAGWEIAKRLKAEAGIKGPGPRDYPGTAPLTEPESRSVVALTREHDFVLTLSFHTQGKVIYWKYLDFEPDRSKAIAQTLANASGYAMEETPIFSGHAGYKDWFIQEYNRPGYTIEAGEGISPLPMTDFRAVSEDCLQLFCAALAAAAAL